MATIEKKLVKSKSGYRMVTVDDRIVSPFTVEEPPWIPDYTCSNCQNENCGIKFDFLKRKHHCRRCGKCFCDNCCSSLVALPRMCFIDPVRHCKQCAPISKKEIEFFEKHLKILLDGGKFTIDSEDDGTGGADSGASTNRVVVCTLSGDHRYLEFQGNNQGQVNIAVQKISSVEVTGGENDNHGIAIQYMNTTGDKVWLEMSVTDRSCDQQPTRNWVTSMQRAFKLLSDSPCSSP